MATVERSKRIRRTKSLKMKTRNIKPAQVSGHVQIAAVEDIPVGADAIRQ
jgi:hypothetical protein